MKHNNYEYEVDYCTQGTLDPTTPLKWTYKIFDVRDDYYCINIDCDVESDEWYDTKDEANEAAISHINGLEEGPEE